MPGLRRDTRWWGWGDPGHDTSLPAGAERMLSGLGIATEPAATIPDIASVELPDPVPIPDAVLDAAGRENVSASHEDRLRHSGGQSLADLLERRSGRIAEAPDAVVSIDSAARLRPLLEACSKASVAVVPFGGGTSVVGGVKPAREGLRAVISLDTANLLGAEVDAVSMTARLGAGLRGPEAEASLARSGFTLGHFPQSFEYATIGGFAATRSAGQSSSGYGRFDSLVSSVKMVSPAGPLSTLQTPHTSIGPSLRELIVGSEGALGVIPEVEVRVRPLPRARRYEAWLVDSFEAGNAIVRGLAQRDGLPTIARVSDPDETSVSMGISGPSGAAAGLLSRYLRLRGKSRGCLMIVGLEGSAAEVRRRRPGLSRALRAGGAMSLGSPAGEGWSRSRFHGPYLREALLDRGLVVDTLETAQQWSRHAELYEKVGTAIRSELAALGAPGVVMCHLSHAYRDGASLYFTVIAYPGPDGQLGTWRKIKEAASGAIRSAGGTISHHHATGRDHGPYLEGEIGRLGVETLRSVKATLDPKGIMNPGCLVPARG